MSLLPQKLVERAPVFRFIDSTLLRFGSVGAITTSLDFAVFTGLTKIAALAPIPANVLSYSCGILLSFLLNQRWTFRAHAYKKGNALQGAQFVIANLIGLTLSSAIVGVFVIILPDLFAKLLSIPLVFVWNYMAARFWVFRQ